MQCSRLSPFRTISLARPSSIGLTSAIPQSHHTSIGLLFRTSQVSPVRLLSSISNSPQLRLTQRSLQSNSSKRRESTVSTASPSQSNQPTSASAEPALTWDEFLRLRRIRRFYNLGASIGTSFASLVAGLGILSQQNLADLSQHMFGLDPFVLLGLGAVASWGVGWLLGPLVGTSVFGLLNRSRSKGMATKERDFFERIKKYRVDPSSSSVQNPPPDYYGEKITSVAGYRRWLKDQRAFNRKRQSFI